MKTDHRAMYTQKVITDCFFELLEKMPVNRISVKAICEMAEINRSTFYRHYLDVYDLLEKTEDYYLNGFIRYSQETQTIEEALEVMLVQAGRTDSRFFLLMSPNGSGHFIQRIYEAAYARYQDGFARRYSRLPEYKRRWVFLFLATGAIQIVQDWQKSGMKESVGEIVSLITALDEQVLSANLQ